MTESNNIFIPFAYCSIERASSFLTEALGQTITIEDIEHLIEMNIIKPCIHVDRFFDIDTETPTLEIMFRTTDEMFNKPIDEYLTKNKKRDGSLVLGTKLTDDAPQELKEFMNAFDCYPLFLGELSLIGQVDNKDYLSKIGYMIIDNDELEDELKNDGYGLIVSNNSIHLKALALIYGLCEIDSYFINKLLQVEDGYHVSTLPIKLIHNPKYTILSVLNNIIIKRADLKITADNLRTFIDLKNNNQPIRPILNLGASMFDELKDIQKNQIVQPQRIQPKQSAFICWLIESHPNLGKKVLDKPYSAWETIQAQLSADKVDFDENLTKEAVGKWIKKHTENK